MAIPLDDALSKLTSIQGEAVQWGNGALLVLAGPGSGKTQVLTCRIARLLSETPNSHARVLALTFTNKAADEMKGRVASFVPGLEERATVGTFHHFCGQMLRQHGVHIGINPDFVIYATDDDRKAVLEDGIRRAEAEGQPLSVEDVRFLPVIDRLKSHLVSPEASAKAVDHLLDARRIERVYSAYEQQLKRLNALDFNSLILKAYELAERYPAIASRYRRSHPYWLIDEFQDTTSAQYALVKALAGREFRNVFAVADDDQIIYEWNGASFRQLESFSRDFAAEQIQLPTNYRCPSSIVSAANRLVSYNAQRTPSKRPLVSGRTDLQFPEAEHIQLRIFPDEASEAHGIAQEILDAGQEHWSGTAVLARTRSLLEGLREALSDKRVPAVISRRRDHFLSAEFRWIAALLNQASRPLDARNIRIVVEAFNRLGGCEVEADEIASDAEATGRSYLAVWIDAVRALSPGGYAAELVAAVNPLSDDASRFRSVVGDAVRVFRERLADGEAGADLEEDLLAWHQLSVDIERHVGKRAPLDQFLQELQLRSKVPSSKPTTVTLMTIHGAKGQEFDFVYVIGLAEDIMPSYHSRRRGDHSPQMEEERRNCFVAITRARERLVLSRAESYRGWSKPPSRFLLQMGLGECGA